MKFKGEKILALFFSFIDDSSARHESQRESDGTIDGYQDTYQKSAMFIILRERFLVYIRRKIVLAEKYHNNRVEVI
jgi:hypothetical protein